MRFDWYAVAFYLEETVGGAGGLDFFDNGLLCFFVGVWVQIWADVDRWDRVCHCHDCLFVMFPIGINSSTLLEKTEKVVSGELIGR